MSSWKDLIDVERFVKWLYVHPEYAAECANFGENTYKKWRRYETIPDDSLLKEINDLLEEHEEKFEKINITELLLCVNNAVDICKGEQKMQEKIF